MLKRTKMAVILTGFKQTERVIPHAEVRVVIRRFHPEPEVAASDEDCSNVNNTRAKPEIAAKVEVHSENSCRLPQTSGKPMSTGVNFTNLL